MNKKTQQITITSDFITLGQFIKFVDLIASGGESKEFLKNNEVLVNGEKDFRRGRKIREGDEIEILGTIYQVRR